MTAFDFKEIDKEGWETLLAISKADRFNRWMFEVVKPFINGNSLEIGSGIGNISQYFLECNQQLTVSDLRENYLQFLTLQFAQYPNLKGVINIDLTDEHFDNKHADLLNTFDTVFALNVIEHIKNDDLALSNCRKLLKPGGTLLILVPALPFLYNSLDRELFHFRRYTRGLLEKRIQQSGFKICKSFYFNALGIPAWMWGGAMSSRKTITTGQMNFYNKLVPLARTLDDVLFQRIGLSLITVATKESKTDVSHH